MRICESGFILFAMYKQFSFTALLVLSGTALASTNALLVPPSETAPLAFEAGLAAYNRGDWQAAIHQLEPLRAAGVRMAARGYGMLADAYYRTGATAPALACLDQGRKQWTTDQGLEFLQTRFTRETRTMQTMVRHVEGVFEISLPADANWPEFQRLILPALKNAHQIVTQSLGPATNDPIPVMVYASSAEYTRQTNAPAWSPAHYDGKIRMGLETARSAPDRLLNVLTHELTHCWVDRLARGHCPAWLHEGVAQLVETGGADGFTEMIRNKLREQLRRSPLVDLAKAERTAVVAGHRATTDAIYMEGYLVTLSLFERLGGKGVDTLFTELARGTAFEVILKKTTGMNYAALQEACWKESKLAAAKTAD
jgi:hypothetical protein